MKYQVSFNGKNLPKLYNSGAEAVKAAREFGEGEIKLVAIREELTQTFKGADGKNVQFSR